MRLKKLLLGATTFAIVSAIATSCTNEMVTPYPNAGNAKSVLVHDPDLYAWSGKDFFDNTRSLTRGSFTEITFETVKTDGINQEEEDRIIDEYLPEKNENLKEGIQPNFLFKAEEDLTFDLYPVSVQTNNAKTVRIFYYDNEGVYHETEPLFTELNQQKMTETEHRWNAEKNDNDIILWHVGRKITVPKGYVFGFSWNGNKNWYDFAQGENQGPVTYYSVESWNDEVSRTTGEGVKIEPESKSRLHGVTFELEGKTYLGIEDWTDFDFQDLVFACPENLTEVPVTDIPKKGEPWTGETFPGGTGEVTPPADDLCPVPGCRHPNHDGKDCDQCPEGFEPCHPNHDNDDNDVCDVPECGHPNHNGHACDQCDKGTPCNPGNGTTGDVKFHNDEVEVNFSINDVHTDKNGQKYDNADLWTKLSIHVRKGTDVKIHVPLPGRYLCESDDFAILQDHANGIYTGVGNASEVSDPANRILPYHHEMTYTIRKTGENERVWNVTLNVDITEDGMDVWTDGIDQDLIDYLFEINGDGINFEIWNYYQTDVVDWVDGQKKVSSKLTPEEYEAFQGYLDQSTIDFLDEDPSYYINAFGFDWTDGTYSQSIRPRDCKVTPLHPETFDMHPNYCYHLNGTPWNIIWAQKSLDKNSDCYKAHQIYPNPPVQVDKY